MKKISLSILILGLCTPLVHAAETKESAQEQAKNAATVDLAKAIYDLDVKGVISALERGASLTTLVRTWHHQPGHYFVDTNPLYSYPCMAILVENAQSIDPNYVLGDGSTAKDAITAILAALVKYGLDINANAQLTAGNPGSNPPLFAMFDNMWLADKENRALSDPYFIKVLLDNGANINQQSQIIYNDWLHSKGGGVTALMLAVNKRTPAIFKLLLERGADTTIKDANDHDVMYYIDKSSKKDEFLKILNEYKKSARQTAQKETASYITRDPASLVADYFVEEDPEKAAIREKKSKQEEHEEDEE